MSMIGILLWLAMMGDSGPVIWHGTLVLGDGAHTTFRDDGFAASATDVPAIQVDVISDKPGPTLAGAADMSTYPCPSGQHYELVEGFTDFWECRGAHVVKQRWSCSDKSRILLTAEDGTKHCIKF